MLISSALLRVELLRAVRQDEASRVGRARELIRDIDLYAIDDSILDAAALLEPVSVRSLDAIHLATALAIGEELDMVVTYDQRMIDAAKPLGLPVASPD